MTYFERYLLEHPAYTRGDFVSARCPESKEKECPFVNRPDISCFDCWNRNAPPRKVKVRKKNADMV